MFLSHFKWHYEFTFAQNSKGTLLRQKNCTTVSPPSCRSGWSKIPQWENDKGFFSHNFLPMFVNNYDKFKGQPFNPNVGRYMDLTSLSMLILLYLEVSWRPKFFIFFHLNHDFEPRNSSICYLQLSSGLCNIRISDPIFIEGCGVGSVHNINETWMFHIYF